MFCASGLLFNHEGPRRGFEFVTRKITNTAALIKLGGASELRLGNLEAKRDWGHAADYVRAMHLMLQQPEPDDYVVASGESHTVREFCERAFAELDLDYQDFVKTDERFYRQAEVDQLVGDSSKARKILGWRPTYSFDALVKEMVQSDLEANARTERISKASLRI
jgi:GDPmannose 4,6-dehydratase